MPKTKSGEVISWKEFFVRWKQGMMQITPLQQLIITARGNWLIIIGIIWGVIATAITKTWWLVVILIGSLIVTIVSQLGTYQRIKTMKELEKSLGGGLI